MCLVTNPFFLSCITPFAAFMSALATTNRSCRERSLPHWLATRVHPHTWHLQSGVQWLPSMHGNTQTTQWVRYLPQPHQVDTRREKGKKSLVEHKDSVFCLVVCCKVGVGKKKEGTKQWGSGFLTQIQQRLLAWTSLSIHWWKTYNRVRPTFQRQHQLDFMLLHWHITLNVWRQADNQSI